MRAADWARRARKLLDFLRYALRAAAVAPRTLASVARGRMEPEIADGGDFGGMRHAEHDVAAAGSARELSDLLSAAYEQGRSITLAGSRHSSNGQTLPASGGLQIRLARDSGRWRAPEMVDEEHVVVSGAHTWRTLQDFLRARGRACPVLTDHLTTSIGGTLSVGGGIGTSSVAFGRQLDTVRAFTMVLPTGERVRCSPSENPRLFRHAPGGMGELGMIDEVTLWTRPYRPFLAVHRFQAPSLVDALRAVRHVLEHDDKPAELTHLVIEGPILDTPFVQFEIGFEHADRADAQAVLRRPPAALDELAPLRRVVGSRALVDADVSNTRHGRSAAFVAALTGHKHLWNDFFFAEFAAYERFLEFVERDVFARGGRRFLLSGLAFAYPGDPLDPVHPDHRRAAFSYPCRAGEAYRWSFGFNYSVPDGAHVAPTVATLATLREEATRLGGGVYGYGYNDRTRDDLARAYGPILEDFERLKAEVDPKALLGGSLPLRRSVGARGRAGLPAPSRADRVGQARAAPTGV